MGFLSKFFNNKKVQPEEVYEVSITNEAIHVTHPKFNSSGINWNNIQTIELINTNQGPLLPDVWLSLSGENNNCMIPQGSKGFEEVYAIVSEYEGFNFENVIRSMSCADNAKFLLWTKKD
jgi:hypothetical protein